VTGQQRPRGRRGSLGHWGWSVLPPGDGEVIDLAGGNASSDLGRAKDRQAGQAAEQGVQPVSNAGITLDSDFRRQDHCPIGGTRAFAR
jgi:hypothetical protein